MFEIVENNSRIDVRETGVTHPKLPVGIYSIEYDEMRGVFFLIKKENKFKLPPKLYGDHSIVDRWIKSHQNNTGKNLGILLSGLKGTGKTITAEIFCNKIEKPVILMTRGWTGSKFFDFITNPMFHDTIIFIDEFEKIFNNHRESEAQDAILSLMDGIYNTRFVFLLTVNKDNISEYLINRLGRIKYYKKYENLEQSVIDEVVNDLLEDKTLAPSIIDFQNVYNICTFDILVNVIKEMNLFKEDAISCAKHLLLIPEEAKWTVYQIINDESIYCSDIKLAKINGGLPISFSRSNDVLKKLKVINDEIEKYNKEHEDDENAEYKRTYATSSNLRLEPYEMVVEEESSDVVKIIYTPYDDEDYPSQTFVFEKQKFYNSLLY